MQTQAMLAGGAWRLHRVDYDNAPEGRPMHWASPPRWGSHCWPSLDHGISGRALGAAAEQAVALRQSLAPGCFPLASIPRLARRFGPAGAALMAVGTVASYPFYLNFIAGNAEHQGAAEVCALLTVVCLLGGAGGWVGPRRADAEPGPASDPQRPGGGFWLRPWPGAVGPWLSAASEAPVLAGTGLGALASLALIRRRPGPAGGIFRPELWRLWGARRAAPRVWRPTRSNIFPPKWAGASR